MFTHWNKKTARALLVIFYTALLIGRVNAYINRPIYPENTELPDPWPPAGYLVDAIAVPPNGLITFKSGITVGEAVASLELPVDPHGSGRCIPPAGKFYRSKGGWTVRPMSPKERRVWGIPMDPVVCSVEDFQGIPSIGPSLASKLHRYISERGYISSVDELDDVTGIGPARLKVLKKYLAVL